MGVPVNARRCVAVINIAAFADAVSEFLMDCASSRMMVSKTTSFNAGASRRKVP